MSRVGDLHREAEDWMDRALAAQRAGNQDDARDLFRRALAREREAATAVPLSPEYGLTRAVLYRSAATLALDSEDPAEAERLARLGLEDNPPTEVAQELRDVIGKAQLQFTSLIGAGREAASGTKR